jgi:hypothetical protein
MNAEAPVHPESEAQPAAPATQGIVHEIENFVRREPAKGAAAAFGAGLLLNFVPPRVIVGAATAVAAPFMRPALLALGLLKACELCGADTKFSRYRGR